MFPKQKFVNPRSRISTDRMQQQTREYRNNYLNFLRFLYAGQVKHLFLEVVSVRIRSRTEG
jgi:hypothetical protein